jgi:hypothetical protein
MDPRIRYLQFIRRNPLKVDVMSSTCIIIPAITGLILEFNKVCQPDLKLWLLIVTMRLIIRVILRLFVVGCEMNMITGNILVMNKLQDIIDVFGVVWFAVGNLLVFNNFSCLHISPIVFITSLIYIICCYLSILIPASIKCTLTTCPPRSARDRQWTAEQLREAFVVLQGPPLANPDPATGAVRNNRYTSDLDPQQRQFWSDWLAARGCAEFVYDPAKLSPLIAGTRQSSEQGTESVGECSICLVSFAEPSPVSQDGSLQSQQVNQSEAANHTNIRAVSPTTDIDLEAPVSPPPSFPSNNNTAVIVARYPCHARHLFHANCLRSWLHVSSERGMNRLTCPCCREAPPQLFPADQVNHNR